MNIVFLDEKTMGEVPGLQELRKLGNYKSYPLTFPDERKERIAGADIVITCKVVIDKEIIDSCPSLKLICVAATGTNNVDVDYALSRGIAVKNVTGYSSESVAQCTVAIALSLVNRIGYYDSFVKSGNYASSDMFTHYGPEFYELKGKTLGIIGLGNIGRRVADIFSAFGMKIVYHSVSGKNYHEVYQSVALDDLLSVCDIVSVHCPLSAATRNLINRNNLKLMKPGAVLINMARGGIVNEADVADALDNQILGGFGTDVYEKEPMDANHPFLRAKFPGRMILTPHNAWTSIEARNVLIEKLIHNITSFTA